MSCARVGCLLLVMNALLIGACATEEKEPEPDPSCAAGEERCGETCVDVSTHPEHCGGCGQACDAGQRCEEGICGGGDETCPEGRQACGGACVDVETDDAHCGGCHVACDEGEQCVGGDCVDLCPAGESFCGELGCVDVFGDDPNHCGACGRTCAEGQRCEEGVCLCQEGEEFCGNRCVDVQSELLHCGGCDRLCSAGENASDVSCEAGRCVPTCEEGFEDCDEDPANGCESQIASDEENCGACGRSCADLPKTATATCHDGDCHVLTCEEGFADCDGVAENGCEVDLSQPENCGSCDASCFHLPHSVALPACVEGACEVVCEEGWFDCDGEWINGCEVGAAEMEVNPAHCGGCNIQCEAGDLCSGGICHQDFHIANWPIPPNSPTAADYDFEEDSLTAVDRHTGLEWQREVPPVKREWDDAMAYCENLEFDGKLGWRLPSLIELYTLIDPARPSPTINEEVFPGTEGDYFWTSVPQEGATSPTAFAVRFSSAETSGLYTHVASYVRCVRAGFNRQVERYVVETDVVTDQKTGLMWQRQSPARVEEPKNRADAITYCDQLSLGGYDDWRLPDVKELVSLLDLRLEPPLIDSAVFPETADSDYWTTADSPNMDLFGLVVHFGRGAVTISHVYATTHYRCVRTVEE